MSDVISAADRKWMRAALMMARRGDGRTAPNPSVGCVIVKNDVLVGRGVTADGGRPHAETVALDSAGGLAKGATAYVTLEPCSHHGQTPPCCEALIAAGIARVVIGNQDPDERVSGKGITAMTSAGITVTTGVLSDAIAHQLAGYHHTRIKERPHVTVKIATSLDGKIALKDGTSQWITGALARQYVHLLRSRHDAILTGAGTVRVDNPMLTCRLDGITHQPLRVVMASGQELNPAAQIFATSGQYPTLVICPEDSSHRQTLPEEVKTVTAEKGNDGHLDPMNTLSVLVKQGMTSVLIEAGGKLLASFIKAGLVDRIIWIRNPMVIGGDGLPVVADLGLTDLDAGRGYALYQRQYLGEDVLEIWQRRS